MAIPARVTLLALAVGLVGCETGEPSKVAVSRAALSTPRKVITVGTTTSPRPLSPRRIVASDAGAFILSDEPWFSDGSGQPASSLGDLTPGPAQSADRGVTEYQGAFFFGAWREGVGSTAWKTDGTFDGTRPAFDLTPPLLEKVVGNTPVGLVFQTPPAPGTFTVSLATWRGPTTAPESFFSMRAYDPLPTRFSALDGGMLFFAEGSSRLELFRATGAAGGTVSLSGNRSDLYTINEPLVPFRGEYAFVGDSAGSLFLTDGTPTGTRRTTMGFERILTNLDRTATSLVVGAQTPSDSYRALYFTDGTDAGTRQVYPSQMGSNLTNPTVRAATQTHAFFTGRALANNLTVLWATDGTDAGTVQIANITPSTLPNAPTLVTATHFYFTDTQGRPWASDGTMAGTAPLIAAAYNTTEFLELGPGRVLIFTVGDPTHGAEPWITDGTPAGTTEVVDFVPGFTGSVTFSLAKSVVAGGRAWFACTTPTHGAQTCVTDGTAAGTRVATPTMGPMSQPNIGWLAPAGTRLLIQAGSRLLGSDGTQANTVELPMPAPWGRAASTPTGAWTLTFNSSTSWSLWFTDGTVAGTRLVNDGGIASAQQLMAAGNAVFALGQGTDAGDFLTAWTPDGGLARLPDFTPAPGASTQMSDFAVVGGELAWLGTLPDAGTVIMASDGTAAGTRVVVDPSPSSQVNSVANLTSFGPDLYYRAIRDGGVVVLARTRVGPSPVVEELPLPLGLPLATQRGLFLASGVPLTVARVDPVTLTSTNLGAIGGNTIFTPKPWGDGLVLLTQDTTGRASLWASDGTPNSFRRVAATLESWANDLPTLANAAEASRDEFFVSSWSRDAGLEPAVLTSSGVTPIADLFAGPMSSNPLTPVVLGSTLYFAADDGAGMAVFAVDFTMPPPLGGGGGTAAGGGTATGGGTASGGGTATGGGAATGGGSGTGGGAGTGGGEATGGGGGETGGGSPTGGGGEAPPAGCNCSTGAEAFLLLSLGAWLRRRARR